MMGFRSRTARSGLRTRTLAASIGTLIASGGISGIALGQDVDDEQRAGDQETVIVTGTRIRRDDFDAVNATTVITADDMERLGVVSVADMVNQAIVRAIDDIDAAGFDLHDQFQILNHWR
jgi:hypothetical protein